MPHRGVAFSLVGIAHIVFLVDDLERAVRWYREVLGCPVGYEYPDIGMVQVWAGAALIVLWDTTHPGAANAVPPIPGGRNVDHICLALSPFDPDEMRSHLSHHGVAIQQEVVQGGARGIAFALYVHDPFGNRIELKGPAEYSDGRVL